MKILVIEDSKFMQLLLVRILRRAGHTVLAATDGEQGLCLARNDHPDLVLLDMMLPGMPGTSILRALKHNPATASIPAVVLSGLSQRNQDKLLKEGAQAYLDKSLLNLNEDAEPLLQAIQQALAGPQPLPMTD